MKNQFITTKKIKSIFGQKIKKGETVKVLRASESFTTLEYKGLCFTIDKKFDKNLKEIEK